jgi:hypothetical protein
MQLIHFSCSKLSSHIVFRFRWRLGSAGGALNPALGGVDAALPLIPIIRFFAPRAGGQ